MPKKLPLCLVVGFALIVSAAPAGAASITFSGTDVGGGAGGTRTSSDAAHNAWLAAVGSVSAVEDFEAIAVGTSTPIALAGGMTLTTVGGPIGQGFDLNEVTNDQDDQIGYNTTFGGENYFRFAPEFQGSATMTISFASPVSAFGVYITGIQTGFGSTTANWDGQSFPLVDTDGGAGLGIAGVQFFGFISDTPVSSISFVTTAIPAAGRDVMGFDDIQIVGGSEVPEPSTVGLLLAGLIGVGAAARRRQA